MNNQKGFTLAEMMVSSLLLIVAISGAMSFFIFQSGRGADGTRLKAARQQVTLGLILMRRDIENSALGFTGASADVLPVIKLDGTATKSDQFYVSFGSFMDWTYDINDKTDTNSIFKHSPAQDIGTGSFNNFTYNQIPLWYDLTQETRPVGGFISKVGANTVVADVNWDGGVSNRPSGQQPWNVRLKSVAVGDPPQKVSALSGQVMPAIKFEIADPPAAGPDQVKQPTSELRRNGVRVAGGVNDVDVFFMRIRDRTESYTALDPLGLTWEVVIRYQVRLRKSQPEYIRVGVDAAGTSLKRTWQEGVMRVRAEPRKYSLNVRP